MKMKQLFHADGPVFSFLDTLGQLILLSGLWVLGCMPVITFGTSNTALYYAVIKSVRRGQGSAVSEFLRYYQRNMKIGIGISVSFAGLMTADLILLFHASNALIRGVFILFLIILGFSSVFLSPMASRFQISLWRIWKHAFIAAFRFPHYAIVALFGDIFLALMQLYVFPIPAIFLLPGIWFYSKTFFVEKVLLYFMPEKQDHDDAWYYQS